MPITGEGWEMHIVRQREQQRATGRSRRRSVGKYQVFHNGVAQSASDLHGTVAESRGPGANKHPGGRGKRIEPGRYPLATQDGAKYATFGFVNSESPNANGRKPGFELLSTGDRKEILVHPGQAFLSSIGCINPCTSLANANEQIGYASSRRRVISLIEDMKQFLEGDFPNRNGRRIPRAFVVIDGEP